jgi:hypothetical protein
MRAARKVAWAIGLCAIASLVLIHGVAAQQAQVNFRRGFVSSYVAAAIRRGRPAGPAEVEANCVYGIISAQMTVGQLAELVDEQHGSRPPAALAPLMPEIRRRCLHRDGAGPSMTLPGGAVMTQRAAIADDVDSAAVAQAMRRLRVDEEARLMAAGGAPVMLPTGTCTAAVTVDSAGQPVPGFVVYCRDERMEGVMRRAVTAAAPLRAAPGSILRLVIRAPDPEPGADR